MITGGTRGFGLQCARWLVEQGHPCERAARSKGFRVLVVTAPRG